MCLQIYLSGKIMIKNRFLAFSFCLIFLTEFQLAFSKEKEWERVYLATYPRSGNHWFRYLIEEATHIATSSVYCDNDPPHMENPFPWGGYCCDHGYNGDCRYPENDEFVLVKTHFPAQEKKVTRFDQCPYYLTIRVVRHPVDSFYSRYVRKYAKESQTQSTVPTKRVKEFIDSWSRFQKYWNKKKNVLTIRYEDALANPAAELKKMCNALNYEVTDEDIERAVAKHPPQGYMLKHKEKFTESDLKLISKELRSLMRQFNYTLP